MAEEHDHCADAALAAAAQAGDDAAFLHLVALLQPQVIRFLASQLTDPHELDLDDLTQQTFDAAYDGLARLRNPALVWPWLRTIAFRCLLDEIARQRPLVPLDTLAVPPAAPSTEDETTMPLGEDISALGDALAPLVRLAAAGYTTREIAARLGRTHPSVKRGLSRARHVLRVLYRND